MILSLYFLSFFCCTLVILEIPYYCFCFAMKKFHGLTCFLSFLEKLLQLPVTLHILATLDSNIHGKTFAVTKRSAKTAKLFHLETKAIYGIKLYSICFLKRPSALAYLRP